MSGWPTNWNDEAYGLRLFESVAGAGAAEFPAQKAREDLERLRGTAAKVKYYVDKLLTPGHDTARRSARPQKPLENWRDPLKLPWIS
jgi:hypothetical protein